VTSSLLLTLSLLATEPVQPLDLRAPETATGAAGAESTTVTRTAQPPPSILAPPPPRGLTRVETTWRPFLGFVGNSWGAIGEARIEHYFKRPFMLGVELSPVAVASSGDGLGALTDARVLGAFVSRYLTLGVGVGGEMKKLGGYRGLSVAPHARIGSIDGLNLELTYSHSLKRNQYTDKPTLGFANALAKLQVPVAPAVALQLDLGLSLEPWAYATFGLRYRLWGNGGPNTFYLSGAVGIAAVGDRSACNYDASVPCRPSALSYGPTTSVGIEYRF
jgi:hypothetical protein